MRSSLSQCTDKIYWNQQLISEKKKKCNYEYLIIFVLSKVLNSIIVE